MNIDAAQFHIEAAKDELRYISDPKYVGAVANIRQRLTIALRELGTTSVPDRAAAE